MKVPADFGSKEVTWTIALRGAIYAIPGNLRPNWQIDALEGEAGSGNTPAALKFEGVRPAGSGHQVGTVHGRRPHAGQVVPAGERHRPDGTAMSAGH